VGQFFWWVSIFFLYFIGTSEGGQSFPFIFLSFKEVLLYIHIFYAFSFTFYLFFNLN
jgi:hypothetical protein